MCAAASGATTTLHATTVSVQGQGILIIGPSGAGKSALALQLISLGAQLVSDDRTCVTADKNGLTATAPATIAGLIEARGVGLLSTPAVGSTRLALVVDLSRLEQDRLPQPHTCTIANITLPCLWGVAASHFAPAILLYLKGGLGDAHE